MVHYRILPTSVFSSCLVNLGVFLSLVVNNYVRYAGLVSISEAAKSSIAFDSIYGQAFSIVNWIHINGPNLMALFILFVSSI